LDALALALALATFVVSDMPGKEGYCTRTLMSGFGGKKKRTGCECLFLSNPLLFEKVSAVRSKRTVARSRKQCPPHTTKVKDTL
jgi:hypothetical protein